MVANNLLRNYLYRINTPTLLQPEVAYTATFQNRDAQPNYIFSDRNRNGNIDTEEQITLDQLRNLAGEDKTLTAEEAETNNLAVFNQGENKVNSLKEIGFSSINFNLDPKSNIFGRFIEFAPLTTQNGDQFVVSNAPVRTQPISNTPVTVNQSTGGGNGVVTGNGNDTVNITGAGTGGGGIVTMGGDDTATVDGKTGGINLGTGNDTLRLGLNFNTGGITGGSGDDRLVLTGGRDKWLVEQVDKTTYVSVKDRPETRTAVTDFEKIEYE